MYAETPRYNYGPIWFYILYGLRGSLRTIGLDTIYYFHLTIAAILTLVDVALALHLRNRFGFGPAIFFFLNPISILITGYHSQFDNLAVLLCLLACSTLEGSYRNASVTKIILSLALIGLSITTKHIFLFFSLWLWFAVPIQNRAAKALALASPCIIFILSFLPFAFEPASIKGIIANVFKYQSLNGNGLPALVLELWQGRPLSTSTSEGSIVKYLFVFTVALSGILWSRALQKKNRPDASSHPVVILSQIYLLTLVGFSSAMANQYLAIPLYAFAILHRHSVSWLYTIAGSIVLLTSVDNILVGKYQHLDLLGYLPSQLLCIIAIYFLVKVSRKNSPVP